MALMLQKRMVLVQVVATLVLAGAGHVALAETTPTTAPTSLPVINRSALGRLQRDTLHQVLMPNRLVLGQDNTFTARTQPFYKVWLVYAPQADPNGGTRLASGHTFPLPWPSPYVEAEANAQGVATLTLPIPLEADLAGASVTLAALTFPPNQTDAAKVMTLLDGATGKAGTQVALTLILPEENRKGIAFLPALPGMDPTMMRQLQQTSELMQNTEKRERLWNDGSLSRDTQSQRNTLLLPGASGASGGVGQ
jgi:hypothetical protein